MSSIINLDYILSKLEDILSDSEFKDGSNFSRIKKRKNEKEEKSFTSRITTSMRQLLEYKGERSMVQIFHIRFIHTNQHIKRSKSQKIITIITEYIRLLNKSNEGNEGSYHQLLLSSTTPSSNLLQSSSKPQQQAQEQPQPQQQPNNNSPNNSFISSNGSNGSNNNVDNCNISEINENNVNSESSTAASGTKESGIVSYSIGSSLTYVPFYNSNNVYNQNIGEDMEINSNVSTLPKDNLSGSLQSHYNSPLNPSGAPSGSAQTPPRVELSREIKAARDLLEYLTSHQLDPDNSLVGCDLNPAYMDGIVKHRQANTFDKKFLVKTIKQWGYLKDEALIKEVRKMSHTLHNVDFKKGELIIVDLTHDGASDSASALHSISHSTTTDEFELDYESLVETESSSSSFLSDVNTKTGSNLLFARFDEERPNKICKFFNNPSEDPSNTLTCPLEHVYKLSPEVVELIKNEKTIIKLVNDPSVAFCHMLSLKERALFYNYIHSKFSIDAQVLEKLRTNQFSIIDLPALKTFIASLTGLEKGLQGCQLWGDVLALAVKESKPFMESVRKNCMYIPLYCQLEDFIKSIESNREKQLRSRIKKQIISFDAAFHKIHQEKKDYFEGNSKNKLSQGYLAMIRERVDEFLIRHGYNPSAVPVDYLSQPPPNPAHVKLNLDLLHSLLVQTPDSEPPIQKEFKAILTKLKDQIYEMIDDFILKSKLNILDSFDLLTASHKVLEERGHLEINFIKSMINHKKDSIEKQKTIQYDRMLKDIEYLVDMKEKEGTVVEKRLEIVTISGLVYGKIHRFENEARTTLEVWGYSAQLAPKTTDTNAHLPPSKPLPSLPPLSRKESNANLQSLLTSSAPASTSTASNNSNAPTSNGGTEKPIPPSQSTKPVNINSISNKASWSFSSDPTKTTNNQKFLQQNSQRSKLQLSTSQQSVSPSTSPNEAPQPSLSSSGSRAIPPQPNTSSLTSSGTRAISPTPTSSNPTSPSTSTTSPLTSSGTRAISPPISSNPTSPSTSTTSPPTSSGTRAISPPPITGSNSSASATPSTGSGTRAMSPPTIVSTPITTSKSTPLTSSGARAVPPQPSTSPPSQPAVPPRKFITSLSQSHIVPENGNTPSTSSKPPPSKLTSQLSDGKLPIGGSGFMKLTPSSSTSTSSSNSSNIQNTNGNIHHAPSKSLSSLSLNSLANTNTGTTISK